MTLLTNKLAADLAERLTDAAIDLLSDAEMHAIAKGGPGDYDLTQATDEQLERLHRGEDILAVLGPDFPRNPTHDPA